MEGVASEAASLAGTLGLGKLIYLYDDNKITIEGSTDIAFTEDVEARFKAYGWQVLRVADSEDIEAMEAAVKEAQADTEHPSLIIVRTHIGYGSPKQDSASCHGEPLGAEALALTKRKKPAGLLVNVLCAFDCQPVFQKIKSKIAKAIKKPGKLDG